MAVKFWVAPNTATVRGYGIDPSPLAKQVTTGGALDETDRVEIGQPDTLWRLRGYPGAVDASHGGITKVTLHARIYMSNTGSFSWDFSTNNAFVAPYVVTGGATTYDLPDWIGSLFAGYSFDNGYNWNTGGQPVSKHIDWDITSVTSWTNLLLAGCEFGLALDEAYVSANHSAGYMPLDGPAGSTPRWNVSQLILEVDAADPPAVIGKSFIAVFS